MNRLTHSKGIFILTIFLFTACAQEDEFPVLRGSYFGQNTPGLKPEIFAPGTISTGLEERNLIFSPDGEELFYSVYFNGCHFLITSKVEDGRWTAPEIASFSGQFSDFEPCYHPDGSKLYFVSDRPLENPLKTPVNFNIWFVEKYEAKWGEPKPIGSPINSQRDVMFPSVTRDGTLYFTGRTEDGGEAIYRSDYANGKYQHPEKLPPHINAARQQGNAWISPDENFLIVCTGGRTDAVGGWDYYVTFRDEADQWSRLINLGNAINSERDEYAPSLSPDGKYFIFQTQDKSVKRYDRPLNYSDILNMNKIGGNGSNDIYWVDAKIITNLKPEG